VSLGTAEGDGKLEDAIAVCLSGGGYRALLVYVVSSGA
jgi:hypothetical protein